MAFTGIELPVQVTKSGGVKKVSDGKQLRKLFLMAFSEGSDNNPFQDLGVDMSLIFSMQSTVTPGEIVEIVKDIVKLFEGRIELIQENPISIVRDTEGEREVIVKWLEHNTNQIEEFKRTQIR